MINWSVSFFMLSGMHSNWLLFLLHLSSSSNWSMIRLDTVSIHCEGFLDMKSLYSKVT